MLSVKSNKSPGCDGISYNAIEKYFDSLCEPSEYLLNLSIDKGAFLDNLKMYQCFTPLHALCALRAFLPYVLPCLTHLRALRALLTRLIYAPCAPYLCGLKYF